MKISFIKEFLSSYDVFLHHFTEENIVDFNIMCRQSVVQETWWEHQIVSLKPEQGTILTVEHSLISSMSESASGEDHSCAPKVAVECWVVQWAVAKVGKESRSNWSHDSIHMEDLHDKPVDDSEDSMEGVCAVLSLSYFDALEDSSDEAWSSSKSFINEVLKSSSVSQEKLLYSLRHY